MWVHKFYVGKMTILGGKMFNDFENYPQVVRELGYAQVMPSFYSKFDFHDSRLWMKQQIDDQLEMAT